MSHVLAVASACLLLCATVAQSASRSAAASNKAGAAPRMVCKTYVRIGTLADRHRICKTQAEWDEERKLREFNPSEACRTNDDAFAPCK
jgi:hypothetical protein